MPKPRTAFRIIALVLMLFAVIVSVPLLARLSTGDNGNAVDTRDGAAEIYFVANRQLVPIDTSCIEVEWRVEGIRTVQVNGRPAIGEGAQTVCAESPRLTVTMQDGSLREYRLPRQIAFTTPHRVLIVVSAALILVAFIPWRTPRFARPFLTRFRAWVAAEDRSILLAVLILTLIAAVLRLLYLNEPMKQDEVVTFVVYASKDLGTAISTYESVNNHLFHTLLVNIAYTLLGNEPWVLRLPVFFAGILLIPATYAAGRSLYSSQAGLFASAFAAASSLLTIFSIFARGYMLIALCTLLLVSLSTYLLRNPDRLAWFAFAVISALGFYSNISFLYPYGGIMLWLLVSSFALPPKGRNQFLAHFLSATFLAAVFTFILYLPMFIVAGPQALLGSEYVQPMTMPDFIEDLSRRLGSSWRASLLDIPGLLQFAIVAGFLSAMVFHKRIAKTRLSLYPFLLVWLVVIFLIIRVFIYERVLLPLLPLFFIAACGGFIDWLRLSPRFAASAAVLLAGALAGIVVANNSVHLDVHYDMGAFPDAAVAITDLAPQLEPGDVVIAHRRSAVLDYYFQLYDIGEEYTAVPNEPSSARRVFIFAPYPSQPPDKVLDEYDFDPEDFSAPALLRHYGGYALYLVHTASLAVQST